MLSSVGQWPYTSSQKMSVHYISGIFPLYINTTSHIRNTRGKKRYSHSPASITRLSHFMPKKIILHSVVSFDIIGQAGLHKFLKFITFSKSTWCSHGQVMKNITKILHHASFHTDYFFAGSCLDFVCDNCFYILKNRLLTAWQWTSFPFDSQ